MADQQEEHNDSSRPSDGLAPSSIKTNFSIAASDDPFNERRLSLPPLMKPTLASPQITPDQNAASSSQGMRRWRLLRNVYKTVRFSSLTADESRVLNALSGSGKKRYSSMPMGANRVNTGKSETANVTINEPTKASSSSKNQRARLRKSIAVFGSRLMDKEKEFLQCLADCTDVDEELVENAVEVLQNDKLFDEEATAITLDMEQQVEEVVVKEGKKERPQLQKHHGDGTFRKEIWGLPSSRSFRVLVPKEDEFGNIEVSQEDPIEASDNNAATETKEEGFNIVKAFQNIFRPKDEKKRDAAQKEVGAPQQEEELPMIILGTSGDDPKAFPHVLTPPIMNSLRPYMPFSVQQDNFWLKYSLVRDGASVQTMMRNVRSSARTVLAIETVDGYVLGAFTSSPWRFSRNRDYYGSGEAFLWRVSQSRFAPTNNAEEQAELESQTNIYRWTGKNRNIQMVLPDGTIMVGGGAPENDEPRHEEKAFYGSGLVLDHDLVSGTSERCITFGNPSAIVDAPVFRIANLEVWALTPVADAATAEKLELSRQFIFDHGNVLQN